MSCQVKCNTGFLNCEVIWNVKLGCKNTHTGADTEVIRGGGIPRAQNKFVSPLDPTLITHDDIYPILMSILEIFHEFQCISNLLFKKKIIFYFFWTITFNSGHPLEPPSPCGRPCTHTDTFHIHRPFRSGGGGQNTPLRFRRGGGGVVCLCPYWVPYWTFWEALTVGGKGHF